MLFPLFLWLILISPLGLSLNAPSTWKPSLIALFPPQISLCVRLCSPLLYYFLPFSLSFNPLSSVFDWKLGEAATHVHHSGPNV